MFHACVQIFDVMDTVEFFFRTKQGVVEDIFELERSMTKSIPNSHASLHMICSWLLGSSWYDLQITKRGVVLKRHECH